MKTKLGATLIELLVVMGILAILGGVLIAIFISSNRTNESLTTQTQMQSDIRLGMDELAKEIKQAHTVLTTYDPYFTDPTNLILKLASIDSNQKIIPDTYDYIIIYLDSSNLTKRVIADPASSRVDTTKTVLTHTSSVSFTYLDLAGNPLSETYEATTLIEISLQNERIIRGQTKQANLAGKARLRNR